MAINGTAAHEAIAASEGLPPLVRAAVALARECGFEFSCLPEHGELLRVLARGAGPGVIGETGTGCGVGLAWIASAAHPEAHIISVERDVHRARRVAELFRDVPQVRVLRGDWRGLREYGPFDLLALDGGGQGKGTDPPIDPAHWLSRGGLVVMDDFAPLTGWPPLFQGEIDEVRRHWLEHPRLRATQMNVTRDWSALLAAYVG
jgi:predicted O-methyltransferase YrrM